MDCDDYACEDLIQKLHECIKDNDIAICGYYEDTNGILKEAEKMKEKEINKKTFFDNLSADCCKGFLWNKLFKKEIIVENNIRFDEGKKICEDLIFVIEYARKCTKFGYISDALYCYRIHGCSTMNSNKKEKVYNEIISISKAIDLLKWINESDIQYKYQTMFILLGKDYIYKYGENRFIQEKICEYVKHGCIKKEKNLKLKLKLVLMVYFPHMGCYIKKIIKK